MKKIFKKVLSNQWTIAFIPPLILAIITPIFVSWVNNINLIESFYLIFIFLKNSFLSLLNYKVPLWVILIIILFKFILNLMRKFWKNKKSSYKREYPNWYYNFREMKFKDWLFIWNYDMHLYSDNIIDFSDLKPICDCKCNLLKKSKIGNRYYNSPVLQCPNCKKIYNNPKMEDIDEIKCLILHKINTEYVQN